MSLRTERTAEKKPLQIDGRIALYAIVVILLIALAFYFFPKNTEKKSSNNEIIKVANNEQIVQDFMEKNPGYEANVVILNAKNLTSLSEELPALYGDLPKTELYRVEYSSDQDSIFVIIDKSLKVVKYFKMYSVGLGNMQATS